MLKLLLILPLVAQTTSDDPPHLFRDINLDEAIATAAKEKKIVILDAMTSWCSPCRQMELTTWRDPKLVPWLSERAVCIKLDMDVHLDVKKRLGVRGYPTIVAFRDGIAFDQVIGFKSASQIRAWIEGLEDGSTDSQRLLQRVEHFKNMRIQDVNFEDRRAVAESLLNYGKDEVAAEELFWLWNNIPKHAPLLLGWRWDVLPGQLGPLTERVEGVRARIATQRLAMRPLKTRLPSITKLRDWIELNTMLGDDGATAIFCGAAMEVSSGRRLMRKLDHRLFPLFVEQGDWQAAGLVLEDPVAEALRILDGLDSYDSTFTAKSRPSSGPGSAEADPKSRRIAAIPLIPANAMDSILEESLTRAARELKIRRMIEQDIRQSLSIRYGALLAADRDAEATRLTEALLDCLDDSLSRITLVTQSIAAGASQKHTARHIRWLEEALE